MEETATTRAKFKVQFAKAELNGAGQQYSEHVVFSPVYSSDPTSENRAFWNATPTGQVELWINNPQAWGKFIAGQEYYLDFTLAPQLVSV